MQTDERIKALENRVAALEAENQAPHGIETNPNTEAIVDAVIKAVNQRTIEKGKAQLLI